MRTIAILGASGFIGTRLVEVFHLGGVAQVRPIVRHFPSLARLSRFGLDCHMADARDEAALAKAFEGCDAVVNATIGDARTIEAIIEPVWKACVAARVRRLVYLSSGSVHGQAPAQGTDETTPLSDQQWHWYNNAKVHAEWKLAELRKTGGVESVVLRPTIVFGPRSRWIWDAAREIANGRACLLEGGKGICNTIYVDNLVNAIQLVIEKPTAAGKTFLVGDEETVTWRDFYASICQHLKAAEPASVSPRKMTAILEFSLVEKVRGISGMQKVLPLIPNPVKRAVKGALSGWSEKEAPSAWRLRQAEPIGLSSEMNALQQCQWRLPHKRAAEELGYRAPMSFKEGMRRSLAWLDFAGFNLAR
jgi:nucleoside-diphosphate-sugar epimerase